MKSFVAASFLALSASAVAAPSARARLAERQSDTCIVDTVSNPDSNAIIASINQWNNDVATVNAFLNIASTLVHDPATLQAHTQTVKLSAQDEPCQFQTLLNNPDLAGNPGSLSTAFGCASTDLGNVFKPHVLDNLDAIIANPSDTAAVLSAISDINTFRCCNVLPDVDLLWVDTADDYGVSDQVNFSAPREDSCAAIDCSTVATAATCKSLGQ